MKTVTQRIEDKIAQSVLKSKTPSKVLLGKTEYEEFQSSFQPTENGEKRKVGDLVSYHSKFELLVVQTKHKNYIKLV